MWHLLCPGTFGLGSATSHGCFTFMLYTSFWRSRHSMGLESWRQDPCNLCQDYFPNLLCYDWPTLCISELPRLILRVLMFASGINLETIMLTWLNLLLPSKIMAFFLIGPAKFPTRGRRFLFQCQKAWEQKVYSPRFCQRRVFMHADIAEQIEMTHQIMDHWSQLFPGRILKVKYEDLVINQEKISRTLIQHCGLNWEPQVLQFHTTSRNVQTASVAQVFPPLYPLIESHRKNFLWFVEVKDRDNRQ